MLSTILVAFCGRPNNGPNATSAASAKLTTPNLTRLAPILPASSSAATTLAANNFIVMKFPGCPQSSGLSIDVDASITNVTTGYDSQPAVVVGVVVAVVVSVEVMVVDGVEVSVVVGLEVIVDVGVVVGVDSRRIRL